MQCKTFHLLWLNGGFLIMKLFANQNNRKSQIIIIIAQTTYIHILFINIQYSKFYANYDWIFLLIRIFDGIVMEFNITNDFQQNPNCTDEKEKIRSSETLIDPVVETKFAHRTLLSSFANTGLTRKVHYEVRSRGLAEEEVSS